jgi:putative FmdB family regulatory protein
MPTYEYRCKDCGHELETQQKFTDDPLTECPSCGGTLKKKFGAVGISFKGSGFYKNDARPTTRAKTKSEAGSGDSGTTDGSSADGGTGSSSTSSTESTTSTSDSGSSSKAAAASDSGSSGGSGPSTSTSTPKSATPA